MSRNALLSGLPEDTRQYILDHSTTVQLKRRQMIKGPMVQRTHVYFPESGAITTEAGVGRTRIGVGLVGRRGFVGLASILKIPSSPLVAVVVDPGEALAVPVDAFHDRMQCDSAFSQQMNRYLHSRLVLLAQINFCNAAHATEERVARWLLVGSHATGSDELCVSHLELGNMLGIRRPSVSTALQRLKAEGALSLDRRCVRVEDREALQKSSCACSHHMVAETNKGISPPMRRAADCAGEPAQRPPFDHRCYRAVPFVVPAGALVVLVVAVGAVVTDLRPPYQPPYQPPQESPARTMIAIMINHIQKRPTPAP